MLRMLIMFVLLGLTLMGNDHTVLVSLMIILATGAVLDWWGK